MPRYLDSTHRAWKALLRWSLERQDAAIARSASSMTRQPCVSLANNRFRVLPAFFEGLKAELFNPLALRQQL